MIELTCEFYEFPNAPTKIACFLEASPNKNKLIEKAITSALPDTTCSKLEASFDLHSLLTLAQMDMWR